MTERPMTFAEHLSELRKRLLVAVVAFVAASLAAFAYVEPMADFLMRPAGTLKFVYLSPPELFMAYVKIALVAGLVVSLPIILYELWIFIAPGLAVKERRMVFGALFFSGFFFALGAAFAYGVILPFTLKFFLSYSSPRVEAFFSVSDYFGFLSSLVVAFGAAFELPMAAWLLGALGFLKAETLLKFRRLAILGIFIAAAILTPPDVVSQVLLAVPMLGLYELAVIILKVQGRRRARRQAEDELLEDDAEPA